MINYLKHLEDVINAVTISSMISYLWFGSPQELLHTNTKRKMTSSTQRDYLRYRLQNHLYSNFYCTGEVVKNINVFKNCDFESNSFIHLLSDANRGKGHFTSGWVIEEVDQDKVTIKKDGLRVWTYISRLSDMDNIQVSKLTGVRFPKELKNISPGFFMILGNEIFLDEKAIVRLYWNLKPEGAIKLIRNVTDIFNNNRIPFKLKVLNEPQDYTRCDSGVIYIPKQYIKEVINHIGTFYDEMIEHLNGNVPAFTKKIGFGLGLAEEPYSHESFGQHGCRIIAEGLIKLYEANVKGAESKLKEMINHLSQNGIDINFPYINQGSLDEYNYSFEKKIAHVSLHTQNSFHAGGKNQYLELAVKMGERLVKEAVWYNNRCNWLGNKNFYQISERVYGNMGADLYSGTSGIAYFLGELCKIVDSDEFRNTAKGAIRNSLKGLQSCDNKNKVSFFSGHLGVAYVAVGLGIMFGDDEILSEAVKVIENLNLEQSESQEFDLICGKAGAIIALLNIAGKLQDDRLIETAKYLGDSLVDTGIETENGLFWANRRFEKSGLTGISHGNAGVVYALSELYRFINDNKYKCAVDKAVEYENYWFDSEKKNWYDLRNVSTRQKSLKKALVCGNHWCHGAPGVALSRIHAYSVFNKDHYKSDAITALETTKGIVLEALYYGNENFSLCHGILGNSLVLVHGMHAFNNLEFSDIIKDVCNLGLNKYVNQNQPWFCGTYHGETPGLMLGLAGIGYFYTKVYTDDTSSILYINC